MRILLLVSTLFFSSYVFNLHDEKIQYELMRTLHFQTTSDWIKSSALQDKKRGVEIISLQRTAIQSDSGKKYIATQSCKIERIPPTTIKSYSLSALSVFQKKKDFRIAKTITHTDGLLQLTYAIGYWAYYVDNANILHRLIIVHGIHQNANGMQFFIDCPDEVFLQLEAEITDEIRTLMFL